MSETVPLEGPEPAMSNHDVLQALLQTAENANAAPVSRLMLAHSTANRINSQFRSAMEALTTATADYQNAFEAEGEANAAQLAALNTLNAALTVQESSQREGTEDTSRCFAAYTAAQAALGSARQAANASDSPAIVAPVHNGASASNRFVIMNTPPKAPNNGSAYE